ncbi:DM13 domain-containing protein [Photobacterium galatheae]|uniref:Phenylalanine--tRNA ligase n=1 Tax=Photobacterium galatheae TaxID=1654360 RepID=A0A066S1E3_9GAMM|nr:DM13 domain-containing protein [Photobacterium galatheae]KDM93473.1 phenylalanine--tRNA ligase [Photobacterium galatheae]MCM0147053.1 DM13 domain-containing protein [Photobacterium galatheae]
MKLKTFMTLSVTHLSVGVLGFVLGIYLLPILIAPPAPTEAEVIQISSQAQYSATFRKDLKDSDTFHWGEGQVSLTAEFITFMGQLAPGPDYKLYVSPAFVETEADFQRLKNEMALVGDVKTFENFVVEVPQDIDLSGYNTVIVWCETFGEFITSAKYQ